jgi:4-hydroxybenzoate polyprenyltransferase
MVVSRIGGYVRGSFMPAVYLPYAVAWALGVTALFALADPRIGGWHPNGATILTCVTFALALLLVRAVDDIRDLDYDRVHNPGRPLPSGAVRVRDLVLLIAACAFVGLALNSGRGMVVVALAVVLCYTVGILVIDRTLGWPPGDNLLLSGVVGLPVQILLNLYLYAGVLRSVGLGPSWYVALPLLVALAAFVHLEYARKATRTPRPGERSYVTAFGATGTAVIGAVGAVVSAALGTVLTRPWAADGRPWGWLVLVPLAFVLYGGLRFWRARADRWPVLAALLFLCTSFLGYLAVALLGRSAS